MTFNEKLIKLRKANALSQEELAEKIDVSRQAISKWELGDVTPDSDKIVALSKTFGVTTDYLLIDELETPNATVIMCEKPDRNIFVSKILQFLSTFFYAIGLLLSWIIWLNEFGNPYFQYPRPSMGLMSIFAGILVQSIGIACYYVGKKFNKSNLKFKHVFVNVALWSFIPIAGFYTLFANQITAPYPYPEMEYILWCHLYYFITIGVEAAILLIIYKCRKKKSSSQNN